jgi:hypothetical protein
MSLYLFLRDFLSKHSKCLIDVTCFGLILLIAIKTASSANQRDIAFCDEQEYMAAGYQIAQGHMPKADYGPLYSLWYFAIFRLHSDPVRLYDLNWQLLVILLPTAVYGFARSLGAAPAGALLAAWLLFHTRAFTLVPFVNHYAALLLLVGATLAVYAGSRWYLVVGATFLLVSYIRPEFYLALFVILVVGAGRLATSYFQARPETSWRRVGLELAGVTAPAVAFLGLVGNPLGGERSAIAFCQTYALNVSQSEQLALDPWFSWERIVARDFGDGSMSVARALRANPSAILRHMAMNVHSIPGSWVALLYPDFNLPGGVERWALSVLLAAGFVGFLLGAWRLIRQEADNSRHRSAVAGVMLLGILVGTVPGALFIYTTPRLLIPITVFTVAVAAVGLSGLPHRRSPATLGYVATTAVVCLVALDLPSPFAEPRANTWLEERESIKSIRVLGITQPVVSLDGNRLRPFMAGLAGTYLGPQPMKPGFLTFLRQNDVSLVFIDRALTSHPYYRDDPEFHDFIAGKNGNGFFRIPLPKTSAKVAIRKGLIPENPLSPR